MRLCNNHDKKTLVILSIVIFTVFTISLTETIQLADGLAASGDRIIYELNPGESQVQTWYVINDENRDIELEFYASGIGSELFVFEEVVTMKANSNNRYDIIVLVPEDHQDNVEYRPDLFVLTRGEKLEDGGAGIVMNIQVKTKSIIKIGDNPIYTSPTIMEKEVEKEIIKEAIKEKPKGEEPTETLEEKLARIQAANEAKKETVQQLENPRIDDKWEEEAVVDYEPEPMGDTQDKVFAVELEKEQECNFIDMILSWFGMGKC